MKKGLNFEDQIAINLDNLHEEWAAHAQTRYEYACEVSHLELKNKKIHEKLKTIRSELLKEAKEQGANNASLQEAYYRTHEDYISAKKDNIEAEYNLSMAWNALVAFDNRKNALENEVKLWKSNYFSSPTEERQIESSKNISVKSKEEASKKVRAGMNKRRTRK